MVERTRVEEGRGIARRLGFFEKYLTVWVLVCIGIGILLGKAFPGMGEALDRISVAQVSIPIAVCLFFMMYPIMVKIDFAEVIKAGKTPKPVVLTLFVNWCIKPFTMVAIATAAVLYGIASGAALATVVGVLIEVPVMLLLVRICLRTQRWFPGGEIAARVQETVTSEAG